MTPLQILQEQIAKLGYSAIERDYVFSDVFTANNVSRTATVAAFTQTPSSYRNAAIAVVETQALVTPDLAAEYRALGAPLLFVVRRENVEVWEIRAAATKRILTTTVENLRALFAENGTEWSAESIHRAKSIGRFSRAAQLDFVDVGLMPLVEGQVHLKLDSLLNEMLAEAAGVRGGRVRYKINQRVLFRTVFRLLAAKVLQDRQHAFASTWNASDINSVLSGISAYYTLESLADENSGLRDVLFASTWERLRKGINFQNISADDLAFVYENTLITQETRKDFGTHGTPRAVAEYVVGKLELWNSDPESLRIYEPFCGAGIFLVAALQSMRDRLPANWTAQQRHRFLVRRIRGDEFDPFAKEVATLSLILADYPNQNGWKISQADLFEAKQLRTRINGANVILCNPPFEDFTPEERLKYGAAATRSVSKSIFALATALDAGPEALGFVLPEPFLKGSRYDEQRKRIDKLYSDVELVALPDRTFKHSVIRSSLLIARNRRVQATNSVGTLASTTIAVRDRDRFLRSGQVTSTRKRAHAESTSGDLWLNELHNVWDYLRNMRRLRAVATASRGIEWLRPQSSAFSPVPKRGYTPGILAANAIRTLSITSSGYLDTRRDELRGNAMEEPWSAPKLIANASRLSRGPWCFAAAIDRLGLVASQQLYGIWPNENVSLEALAAILNSPVAVAYLAVHSPPDRIRLSTLLDVPIPSSVPSELNEMVKKYARLVAQEDDLFSQRKTESAESLLNQIDAMVVAAYDLSPRLEREVLEFFRDEERPTRHEWTHWLPAGFKPFIPLSEYLSPQYQASTKPWLLQIFEPLPRAEAKALREYMD